MTMKKKFGISIFALAMLLIGVVFVVSASANSFQGTLAKNEISGTTNSELIDKQQIPDFGPHTFDDLRKKPNVLATKGQIPQYATQAEKLNWFEKLDKTSYILRDDMSQYGYPNGPVLGYAWDINGYFEVILYKGMNVTDSKINEIYNLVNKKASEASIQEIPVVFYKSDLFQDELSGYDSSYRPLIDAIQITGETGSWGTLGFTAKKSDGTKGYVTVQHLGTYVGYKMYQPTISSNNAIGTVSIISGNYADACFVPYNNVNAKIHIGGGSTAYVADYLDSVPNTNWVGWQVRMSGAASGVTSGYIQGYGTLYNGQTYYNMVYADYSSMGGDSGAPVYMLVNNAIYRILGIHKGTFNGYKWFSPVSGIKSDLGVTPLIV